MKKLMVFGLSLVIFFLFVSLVSGVRINEVMANPDDASQCKDTDCEYIELYTDTSINLTAWKMNTGTDNVSFNFYLIDYLIITRNKTIFVSNFSVNESKVIELSISLHNSERDYVYLYNNNSGLVSNFSYINPTSGKSFQFCSGNWTENVPTPGYENNCTTIANQNNSFQNNSNSTNSNNPPEISLELDWDEDDIVNGEEFEIEVLAYNLKNEDYDVKVYVTFEDDNTIISETYNEEADKWSSSTYYIKSILSGSGNKSVDLSLRIKNKYPNFSGDAKIVAKIRKSEPKNSPAIDEVKEDIEILGNEEESDNKNNTSKTQKISEPVKEKAETAQITGEVIKLGNRQTETKNEKENVLYESSSEKIKKYAIYGLNLILIVIVIFLLVKRRKFKKEES